MEGKEHYEDDEENKKKSESSENNDYFESDDSDEFGLPDMEDADETRHEETDDTFASDDYRSESSDRSDYESDYDDSEYTYKEEEEYEETPQENRNYYVHGLDEEEKKGPGAGLIIFLILLILGGGGYAVYYFMFNKPEPPPIVAKPPVEKKIEKPDSASMQPEPEPIIKDESRVVPGKVTQLSSATGRYYVVVASFIDDDLAMDYGNKLAKKGVGTTLLSPKTDKGFYRLAIGDFASLKDATLKAEEAKSTYGNDVWVIRY